MVCKRVFISGKVQGVSFRYHAHEKAASLNLKGWVRNLEDGRVELLVAGQDSAVEEMITWAQQGPPFAAVEAMEISEVRENLPKDEFFIRRDGGK